MKSNKLLWKNRYFVKNKDGYKCYICKKYQPYSIPIIIDIKNELFLNKEYKNFKECQYYFKKIKKILKFYEIFKCVLE